jgi:hypothetical protein
LRNTKYPGSVDTLTMPPPSVMIAAVFSGTAMREPSVMIFADAPLFEPRPLLRDWKTPGAMSVRSSKAGAVKKSTHWSASVSLTASNTALISPTKSLPSVVRRGS